MVNCTQTGDHRFGDASIWVPMHRVLIGMMSDAKNFKSENFKENIHWSERKDN